MAKAVAMMIDANNLKRQGMRFWIWVVVKVITVGNCLFL